MKEKQDKLKVKEDYASDGTAEDLSESLADEPALPIKKYTKDADKQKVFLSDAEEKEEDSVPECSITCNILKLRCGHKTKERGENVQNINFYDLVPEEQNNFCDAAKPHVAFEDNPIHEPYYVSSEDIVNGAMVPRHDKAQGLPDSPITSQKRSSVNTSGVSGEAENAETHCVSSKEYMEIVKKDECRCNSNDENHLRPCQRRTSFKTEEHKACTAEALLNHLDCQPRFRLVSISVPTDTDTSLSSSLSDSQLLSPNDSDVFRDEEELEGHIVPFLDNTTDTEQDISDEHVYEEPGRSVDAFSFEKKGTGMQTYSLLHRMNNSAAEMGPQFAQRPYMSGFGQPTLSSSPMLSSVRHKSYSKPHYLSLYPRSLSVEGKDMSQRQREAFCSSGSFSRCSPLPSSGMSSPTSVVDIPPPFELAYITKKPITKSYPSLLIEGDSSEKNRKKKSSIKRFLMLKFRRKTESKPAVDVKPSSFKSTAESRHHTPCRLLDLDTHSLSNSPQLNSRSAVKHPVSSESASTCMFYEESKIKGNSVAFLNRSVVRVESFEDRSRVPFIPLPLTKPRSISFPNTDTSDYENVPPISSDYENLQVPQRRPVQRGPFTDFFDRPSRVLSSANDTDGYVDMSSLPGFKGKAQSPQEETERYVNNHALVGSRLLESKTNIKFKFQAVTKLTCLLDFRESVGAAVGDEGEPVLEEERLREILNELPDVYTLHRTVFTELESRIHRWEESQRIADIFLSRKSEFLVFTTYIGHYDRSMSLLEDSCRTSPAFAEVVLQFEQSTSGQTVPLKHQLLQVIVRVAQYRMLLTDYLNNLSPDSKEYEDTQGTVNEQQENLLRLVNIEYSVHGQRDLLQPGRVFVKEGTLMKVSRKSRQPRHLFLMNDVLLYTYPQQDGKYRLKNTLPLSGLKVSKPIIENVQNALKIEGTDISITLSARWVTFYFTMYRSRMIIINSNDQKCHSSLKGFAHSVRDRLHMSLGEKAPTLVPVSQVMMCMNCTSDFSLTLRRHHCHGCGRIVCRSCSRNRYPLKYMRDRMAKVCDHCYNELKKRGGDASASAPTVKDSPRPGRSSRPLSAVFQNIHPPNIWRHRKGTMSFNQEKVASESLPLLGFTVKLSEKHEGEEEANVFQLYHKNTLYYTFKAEDNYTAQRWANAMEEATVL
uniref:FYVE, RhoGEF and PH domain containing 5a n=1 Tax=Echeneis naucrates TaxID=173247 RepID=A0A665V7V1_ECHNA